VKIIVLNEEFVYLALRLLFRIRFSSASREMHEDLEVKCPLLSSECNLNWNVSLEFGSRVVTVGGTES
jgi:hypothetical protein